MPLEIVPCRLAHLRAIVPRLRAEERIELAAVGAEPRHALHSFWRDTIGPQAAVMSGQAIAVWGDAACPLARDGLIWFFTTEAIEKIPVTFARVAKSEIKRMLISRERLRSSVHRSCKRALRFYEMLGFETIEGTAHEGFLEIRISRGNT